MAWIPGQNAQYHEFISPRITYMLGTAAIQGPYFEMRTITGLPQKATWDIASPMLLVTPRLDRIASLQQGYTKAVVKVKGG